MLYSAREARDIALSKRDIFDEIARIEPRLLDAVEAGDISVTVGPDSDTPLTTGFTNDETYYEGYSDPLTNRSDAHKKAVAQMNEVINYFQNKGYVVTRTKVDGVKKFNWIISW